MWGVVPCTNGILEESEKNIPKLQHHPLFEGMLVCHSLTIIDGKLCGDPLDVKMFESTEWLVEESDATQSDKYDLLAPTVVKPPKNNSFTKNMNKISEIGIVQQYQFSSSLQRMSVIVRILGSDYFKAYTKGSPEMIFSLSKPETIPKNIMTILKSYTEQGYRVIAMGQSIINESSAKIAKMTRDEVEQNLEFLGLVVLENRLKEPTVSVIKELREANMHVIMITGDNIQTAVSVAKECGILQPDEMVIDVNIVPNQYKKSQPEIFFNAQNMAPRLSFQGKKLMMLDDVEQGTDLKNYRFALTGQTWQLLKEYYPDIVPKICVKGAIFARMTSDQKQQLVLELMQLGYYVVMCGDGANDCGALRAAHAGVSLSEAESSVASPFTSRIPDITCIPKVIRQGRAALVTSFGIFKFMVAYSLTEFLSVIILYSIDSNLTDLEFLFIDICLIVNFASFFGKTQAYEKKLADKPPMTSLLSFTPLLSLSMHMFIMTIFQAIAYHTVRRFPWFTPFIHTSNIGYICYENYSVFCISMFQYVTMAIIFSRGKPYRKPIYTNGVFTFSIFLLIAICIYITVYPAHWVVNLLELLVPPEYDWRVIILVLALANFLICLVVETFIVEYGIERKLIPKLHQPKKSKKKYLKIEYELNNSPNWPKLNNELPILPITPSVENIIKTMYIETSECTNAVNSQEVNEQKVLRKLDDIRTNGVDNQGYVEDSVMENVSTITKF